MSTNTNNNTSSTTYKRIFNFGLLSKEELELRRQIEEASNHKFSNYTTTPKFQTRPTPQFPLRVFAAVHHAIIATAPPDINNNNNNNNSKNISPQNSSLRDNKKTTPTSPAMMMMINSPRKVHNNNSSF